MNIVILGGGGAGWLSALTLANFFKDNASITLIESDDIGILGAGEGTVPMIQTFIKENNINVGEFLNKTNGTFKLGINFENWQRDGSSFFHDFGYKQLANKFMLPIENRYDFFFKLLSENVELKDYNLSEKFAKDNLAPLVFTQRGPNDVPGYAFHFDARLFADFLKEKSIQKGVRRIEGKMVKVNSYENGDIKSLELENGQVVHGDFFFDCSGFKRELIGKHFNSPWKDYQKYLPVKTAIPFQLPQEEFYIVPYTRATALKYGWVWRIPLQNRYGAGYVFDSNYITPDQAKQEVEEYLGHEVDVIKTINFRAGTYEKIWINNCIAIGLSTGFTEPIEATSLWIAMIILQKIKDSGYLGMLKPSNAIVDEFNKTMLDRNDSILAFLQAHYLTTRKDSDFWRDFRKNNPLTDLLREKMELWNRRPIGRTENIVDRTFTSTSWMIVLNGNGVLNTQPYRDALPYINLRNIPADLDKHNFESACDEQKAHFLDHKNLLEDLQAGMVFGAIKEKYNIPNY